MQQILNLHMLITLGQKIRNIETKKITRGLSFFDKVIMLIGGYVTKSTFAFG